MSGLELNGIEKSYGATRALAGVDLSAAAGEVVGIAGPNGAGKSTLVRVIGGEETPDSGSARFDGAAFDPARSVAIVHQEAQLFPNLTVGQNLMVGREGNRVLRPRLKAIQREHLEHLDLERVVDRPVGSCTLAVQQRVEIARALSREARIFLFDEPNSALTEAESAELFREIHRLADAGHVVLLVSHRLSDLVESCDRVLIVRGGRVADAFSGEALSEDAIARALVVDVESTIVEERPRADPSAPPVLEASGWSGGDGTFADVDLTLRSGSVTALTGVEGSGARELLRSLAGLTPARGEFRLDGEDSRPGPGISFVPASRRDSLFDNLDIGENLAVRQSAEITIGPGVLRKRRIETLGEEQVRRFGIKARNARQAIRSLSGGNQQKVAIAAAIGTRPRVLLLEEPTRGVDVGSRQEIYRLLWDLAASGCAVLMFCTEASEVFDAASRVHVVSDGRLLAAVEVEHRHVEELASALASLELASSRRDQRSKSNQAEKE